MRLYFVNHVQNFLQILTVTGDFPGFLESAKFDPAAMRGLRGCSLHAERHARSLSHTQTHRQVLNLCIRFIDINGCHVCWLP